MFKRLARILLLLLAFTAAPGSAHAQEGISQKQQEKIQARKKKEDRKAVKQEEKRLHKQHLDHQDKATRKRMKQHQRRAERTGNAGQREPFLRRLFHKRR